MKYVFSFLISFACLQAYAQVVLKGYAPAFAGRTISVFEFQDFFTRKRKETELSIIDVKGAFDFMYDATKPIYIDLYLNGIFSGVYVQPGFTYNLKFDEKGKLISIASEDATNEVLTLFEARAEAYHKANKGKNVYKKMGDYIAREKLIADSAGSFAWEILRYRIASLQFMLFVENKDILALNQLESEVFVKNSINNSIPDYFRFLKSYANGRAKSLEIRRVSYDFNQHVKSLLNEVTFIKSDSVQQLAALAIVRKAYRSDWSGPKERLDFIADSIQQRASHPLVKLIANNVKHDGNSLNPGTEISDFSFVAVSGETHTLSSFKGKYVLVDFWFTACGPCIKNFPKLKQLKQLNPDKLEIISLTPNDTQEKVLSFLKKHPDYQWLFSAIDINDDLIPYFNVIYFPTYVLIGPDGKLVKSISSDEMEKNIQSVMALIK